LHHKGLVVNVNIIKMGFIFVLFNMTAIMAAPLNTLVFKDSALASCIKNNAVKNYWQNTEQVTRVKCHGKGIKTLDDLMYFPQITYLSLFNNNISEADLSGLTQLKYINIANNKLTRLNITHLAQLKTLYVFKNKLTTIDFSGLTALNKVRATNNLLDKLDISPLISLEKAYFFDNKLKDLRVKGMPKLIFIELRQNPMPDEVYDRYDEVEGITIVHDGNADDWK